MTIAENITTRSYGQNSAETTFTFACPNCFKQHTGREISTRPFSKVGYLLACGRVMVQMTEEVSNPQKYYRYLLDEKELRAGRTSWIERNIPKGYQLSGNATLYLRKGWKTFASQT